MNKVKKKFFITGFPRSGTTYLSVILNSQKNILCIESALESHNNLDIINNKKNFNIVCSIFEHEFAMYGFKPPDFRECNDLKEMKDQIWIHVLRLRFAIANTNSFEIKTQLRFQEKIVLEHIANIEKLKEDNQDARRRNYRKQYGNDFVF